MMDALLSAFTLILMPEMLMYVFVGVLFGLALGILPGLGGIAGMSILLVLLTAFQANPLVGIAMAIGMIAVIPTSDTFASVLLGIPGSSASQATVLDGFPMSKKGQAARALSAAFTSSLFGGILGVVVLTAIIFVASDIVTSIRSITQFMLAIFGISLVGLLSGRSLLKGFLAAGLGVFFGLVGAGPFDDISRFVLDHTSWLMPMSDWMAQYIPSRVRNPNGPPEELQRYLDDGLKIGMIGLAMFAIPEITDLLRQNKPIAGNHKLGAGWFAGFFDWLKNAPLSLWNAFVGVLVGIIPGLGGSVVDWIAYGQTKAIVQATGGDTSQFGKGDVRGVIGPESANNAKEGGGLVPTLLLGLPGSGSMAIFLGILGYYGLDAGVQMFRTTPLDDLFQYEGSGVVVSGLVITFFIAWTLMIANVMGTALSFGLSKPLSQITRIPFPALAPFLVVVIFFATYKIAASLSFYSFVTLLLLGGVGICLRRFRWSRPAFLIGFVLSGPLEIKFNWASQAILRNNVQTIDWILVSIISAIIVIAIVAGIIALRNETKEGYNHPVSGRERMPAILFSGFVLLVFLFCFLEPMFYGKELFVFGRGVNDAQIPFFLSLIMLPLAAWGFYRAAFVKDESFMTEDNEIDLKRAGIQQRGLLTAFLWLVLYAVLIAFVGYFLATLIYVPLVLFSLSPLSWRWNTGLSFGAIALFILLCDLVNPKLGQGFIQQIYPKGSVYKAYEEANGVPLYENGPWVKAYVKYIRKPQFPGIPR